MAHQYADKSLFALMEEDKKAQVVARVEALKAELEKVQKDEIPDLYLGIAKVDRPVIRVNHEPNPLISTNLPSTLRVVCKNTIMQALLPGWKKKDNWGGARQW